MFREKKMKVTLYIPANERVIDGRNTEGGQVVPAEAHGDKHDV